MDNRLLEIYGQRPSPLRQDDLGLLARMMIAVIRGRGTVGYARRSGVGVVVLHDNEDRKFTVLRDDWRKIMPFIQDGTFSPAVTPAAPRVGYASPEVAYGESVLDRADRFLYDRIVNTLSPLFPEAFPTSNI